VISVLLCENTNMIQLRLTEKARKEFGIKSTALVEPVDCQDGLGAWTLNVFKVGVQKAVIFVNDATLYLPSIKSFKRPTLGEAA